MVCVEEGYGRGTSRANFWSNQKTEAPTGNPSDVLHQMRQRKHHKDKEPAVLNHPPR